MESDLSVVHATAHHSSRTEGTYWKPRTSIAGTIWMHARLPWFQLSRSSWVQRTSRPTGSSTELFLAPLPGRIWPLPHERERWRQAHFLSESTINCRQRPGSTSCSSPGTASWTFLHQDLHFGKVFTPLWEHPLMSSVRPNTHHSLILTTLVTIHFTERQLNVTSLNGF